MIIDFHAGDLPVGPRRRKLPRQQVIDEFVEAGWRFESESSLLAYQYFLTFYPPPGGIVVPVPTPRGQ